eukprot:GHVR01013043.1.p1 GENE.GHVR01013043.1~~GHVR01013043.1.p1  ORF type:complete len:320 (+),score=52.68 GHVR01013043.1:598-1557(+)
MEAGVPVDPLMNTESSKDGTGPEGLAKLLRWLISAARNREAMDHYTVALGMRLVEPSAKVTWKQMVDWCNAKSGKEYVTRLRDAALHKNLKLAKGGYDGKHRAGAQVVNIINEHLKAKNEVALAPFVELARVSKAKYLKDLAELEKRQEVANRNVEWLKRRQIPDDLTLNRECIEAARRNGEIVPVHPTEVNLASYRDKYATGRRVEWDCRWMDEPEVKAKVEGYASDVLNGGAWAQDRKRQRIFRASTEWYLRGTLGGAVTTNEAEVPENDLLGDPTDGLERETGTDPTHGHTHTVRSPIHTRSGRFDQRPPGGGPVR